MKKVLFVVLFLIVASSYASTWNKTFTVNYQLGDGDSKSSARELALEQIKTKASNEAGTYIQSTTKLSNDSLTESIQVISAAMVKLTNIKETLTTKNNQMVLVVSANAVINEDELKSRVKAIQNDKAKAKQIVKLKHDNDDLLVELNNVKKLLAKKNVNSGEVSAILKRQTNLIKRFKTNASNISRVFKKGTLFQMAKKSTGQLSQIKEQLETEFFAPIMGMEIQSELLDVVGISNNVYEAQVSISWHIPKEVTYDTLGKYIKIDKYRSRETPQTFTSYQNDGSNAISSLSKSVHNHLVNQSLSVKVSLGKKGFYIPIFWAQKKQFMTQCQSKESPKNGNDANVCFVPQQKKGANFKGVDYKQNENPIKFRLSKSQVESITSIDTEIIRT
jgi:hypothetical protein